MLGSKVSKSTDTDRALGLAGFPGNLAPGSLHTLRMTPNGADHAPGPGSPSEGRTGTSWGPTKGAAGPPLVPNQHSAPPVFYSSVSGPENGRGLLRTYRLPCPIGSNQNCEGSEESDNLLIFVLYSKTPHAQNAHLFDPGHVCKCLLSGGEASSAANAGRQLPQGAKAQAGTPSSHTGLLPGWRARAGESRPGETQNAVPRPCPLTDSRLCGPAGHVSGRGLRTFTPRARGTLGTRRPALRAQLWLPGAAGTWRCGCCVFPGGGGQFRLPDPRWRSGPNGEALTLRGNLATDHGSQSVVPGMEET